LGDQNIWLENILRSYGKFRITTGIWTQLVHISSLGQLFIFASKMFRSTEDGWLVGIMQNHIWCCIVPHDNN
jgi:hypothetical protein